MKKGLIFIISIIGAFIIYIMVSVFMFFNSNRDIENVFVEGYVYDKSNLPLDNCRIIIFNSTYKQKDSDYTDYSSYLGNEIIESKTDIKGHYNIKINKSAFVLIKAYKKGYKIAESEGIYSKKCIKQSFVLDKGYSKESDLFKKPKVTEIVN